MYWSSHKKEFEIFQGAISLTVNNTFFLINHLVVSMLIIFKLPKKAKSEIVVSPEKWKTFLYFYS